jgi:ribosome-associated protein
MHCNPLNVLEQFQLYELSLRKRAIVCYPYSLNRGIPDNLLYSGDHALDTVTFAREIADWIADKKGENILISELRPITTIADYFVICEAGSDRQLNAIQENIRENAKIAYDLLPLRVEGTGQSGWILMDYGSVVVHIFHPDRRHYYDLETLWKEATILLRMQ